MEEMGADPSWPLEVFREGEQWVFVAYDPKELSRLLRELGCTPERVKTLYFAQQFAEQLDAPLLLDDKEALINLDGTVAITPLSLLGPSLETTKSLKDLHRPSIGFPFRGGSSGKWLERKEVNWIAAGLLLLGIAWFIEGIRYHQASRKYERALTQAAEAHPALASRITRNNIYKKYSSIDHRQREIRETLKKIGRLVSKTSKLDSLHLDERGYEAIIDAPTVKLASLKGIADSLDLPSQPKEKTLHIQGRWQ
jgi:hypothetical protein